MAEAEWKTIADFILKTPLYQEIAVEKSWSTFIGGGNNPAALVVHHATRFDGYCPYCRAPTTFTGASADPKLSIPPEKVFAGIATYQARCARNDTHVLRMYIRFADGKMSKIGQFPSVATLAEGVLKKYTKVLPEEDRQEFSRAIGLAAHGIGIGSFVYLRRIFERLIERRFKEHRDERGWPDDDFERRRMDEKIELLQEFLPDFLVTNRKTYKILSLGIHGLDEATCLAMFAVLQSSILIMLDEDEERRQKELQKKAVQAELNAVNEMLAKAEKASLPTDKDASAT